MIWSYRLVGIRQADALLTVLLHACSGSINKITETLTLTRLLKSIDRAITFDIHVSE